MSDRAKKWISGTNINTIVTVIGIIVGVPSFLAWAGGYMTTEFLYVPLAIEIVIIIILSVLNCKVTKRLTNTENGKREEIGKLERDVAAQKDQAAKWQDVAAVCESELRQCQDDCKFLFNMRNELQLELQRIQEELQRVYESDPSLDPKRKTTLKADIILRPSTPNDVRLMDIHRRLAETRK